MLAPEYRTVSEPYAVRQIGRLRHAAFAFDGDCSGIADINKLQTCDAVPSGYLGSAEQGEHIPASCVRLRQRSGGEYFWRSGDGLPEKGCIVAPAWRSSTCAMRCRPAIIAPNLVQLEILCGHPVASVSEAVAAARS